MWRSEGGGRQGDVGGSCGGAGVREWRNITCEGVYEEEGQKEEDEEGAEVVHMGGGSNNWRVGVMTVICRTLTFIFFVIAPNGQLRYELPANFYTNLSLCMFLFEQQHHASRTPLLYHVIMLEHYHRACNYRRYH